MQSHMFAFDIDLIQQIKNDTSIDDLINYIGEKKPVITEILSNNEIIRWYNDRMEGVDEILDVYNIEVSYDNNNWWITFDTEREVDDVLEMLIDPDDDGNYPIEYNGISYLIRGTEILPA